MELVPWTTTYEVAVTPLRTGGRRDVEVASAHPDAFDGHNIVTRMREFIAAIEQEAHAHEGDPIATGQALARMEALLADVRYARDTLKRLTAEALKAAHVRRLTLQGVVTLEASTETKRSGWEHERLLGAMLDAAGLRVLTGDGEVVDGREAAARMLGWFRPEWRLTPVRDAGLDPDEFCVVDVDDDGKLIRTPSVRIVNNMERD